MLFREGRGTDLLWTLLIKGQGRQPRSTVDYVEKQQKASSKKYPSILFWWWLSKVFSFHSLTISMMCAHHFTAEPSIRLLHSLAATTLLTVRASPGGAVLLKKEDCTHPVWLGTSEMERNQTYFHFLRLPISILFFFKKRGRQMRRIRQEKKKEKENVHKS